MSFNAAILIAPLIDFITGKIIEANAGGDPAKIVGRATELIAINTALSDLNQGNTNGIAGLQAALISTSLSPGEGLALQSLFATIGNQVALLSSVSGGTLLGQAATAIADNILATATTCAQAYVTKYSAAPVAAK
jgi:hypothetical protein